MFGIRLKTWMENYIGRPKKKVQAEAQKQKANRNASRGPILESSESLAQSDTGISSGSQQVLSSSTAEYREGYSTATMDSDRSGLIHYHAPVSLPSPESAYSTGYSTDGTSPGGTAPPEYYINIRTGKHYFPSPAPTPTTPLPNSPFPHLHPSNIPNLPSNTPLHVQHSHKPPNPPFAPTSHRTLPPPAQPPPHPLSLSSPDHYSPWPHSTPLKLLLRPPRREISPKKKSLSPSKPKKWFRQPFHRFAHRRTDSCGDSVPPVDPSKHPHTDKGLSFVPGQDSTASPRQRNRIKTNPWLSTAPPSSHIFLDLHPAFPASPLARNRSCTNTPLQNRKTSHSQPPPLPPPPPPPPLPPPTHDLHTADRSDEDLTFNEMMGTFNESYVYEKETDILSDSDPTDCDDYETDSDADKGGDERDSHDDELDFIDNASATGSDESFPPNTSSCTYHPLPPKNPFLCSGHRRPSRKDSDRRRSLRKVHDHKARKERRRQPGRGSKCEDEEPREQSDGRPRPRVASPVGGLSLRRVLLQRVVGKSMSRGSGGRERDRNEGGSQSTPRVETILLDKEADEKYRELMVEAENIFESLTNSPLVKSRKSYFVREDEQGRREDVGPRKEAKSTFRCREPEPKEPEIPLRKSPKRLSLRLPVESPRTPAEMRTEATKRASFKARSSAHSPLDPLGPTFRNFAVFDPPAHRRIHIPTTSSDDSDPTDAFTPTPQRPPDSSLPPIAFQSLDLGKSLASYCPQSEPVKRKIYSLSNTYDTLVKHLGKTPVIFQHKHPQRPSHYPHPSRDPFRPPDKSLIPTSHV